MPETDGPTPLRIPSDAGPRAVPGGLCPREGRHGDRVTTAVPAPERRWAALAPALRSRNFRMFWAAQIVSTVGTFFQGLAEYWLIYELTRSSLMLGIVGVAGLLPVVPISLVAGVVVDRVPRRRLIMFTQIGLMLQATVFGLLILFGTIQLWHIIALDLIMGALFALDQPARQAFLVDLVAKDDLANAIALNATVFNMARVAGYLLSGLLIATVGAGGAMLANGATYLAPIVALALIRVADEGKDKLRPPLRVALTEGLVALSKRSDLLAVLSLMVVSGALIWPIYLLMPAFASEVFHTDAVGLGVLLAASAVGAVLSTVLVARLRAGRRGKALLVVSLLVPLVLAAFAVSRTLLVGSLVLVGLGLVMLSMQTLINTLIQVNVPDRIRGRIMSIFGLLNAGAPKLGSVVLGAGGDLLGLPLVLGLGAAVSFVYALGLMLFKPSLRELA